MDAAVAVEGSAIEPLRIANNGPPVDLARPTPQARLRVSVNTSSDQAPFVQKTTKARQPKLTGSRIGGPRRI